MSISKEVITGYTKKPTSIEVILYSRKTMLNKQETRTSHTRCIYISIYAPVVLNVDYKVIDNSYPFAFKLYISPRILYWGSFSLDSVSGLFLFTETLTGLLLRPYIDFEKEPSERKQFRTVKINTIKI